MLTYKSSNVSSESEQYQNLFERAYNLVHWAYGRLQDSSETLEVATNLYQYFIRKQPAFSVHLGFHDFGNLAYFRQTSVVGFLNDYRNFLQDNAQWSLPKPTPVGDRQRHGRRHVAGQRPLPVRWIQRGRRQQEARETVRKKTLSDLDSWELGDLHLLRKVPGTGNPAFGHSERTWRRQVDASRRTFDGLRMENLQLSGGAQAVLPMSEPESSARLTGD
jgi:hypothetical protein